MFLEVFPLIPYICATSLTLPKGKCPNNIGFFLSILPAITSFNVPSPPAQSNKSTFFNFLTISLACPLYSVYIISVSYS